MFKYLLCLKPSTPYAVLWNTNLFLPLKNLPSGPKMNIYKIDIDMYSVYTDMMSFPNQEITGRQLSNTILKLRNIDFAPGSGNAIIPDSVI